MTGPAKKRPLAEQDVGSLQLLKPLSRFTALLHQDAGHQNRLLHHDQLLCLLLLMFFNPVITSLRDLGQVLTAVDGTLLRALPRMAWALWIDERNRAAKLHVCFEVLKGVPSLLEVTEGSASETEFLADNLRSGCLYVTDRGYARYSLFQQIIEAESSFVARIRANAATETVEERALSEDDLRSGVVSDRIVRLGRPDGSQGLKEPLRLVEVQAGTRFRPQPNAACHRQDGPARPHNSAHLPTPLAGRVILPLAEGHTQVQAPPDRFARRRDHPGIRRNNRDAFDSHNSRAQAQQTRLGDDITLRTGSGRRRRVDRAPAQTSSHQPCSGIRTAREKTPFGGRG